jgi:nucleoside-diphosphate kinase
MTIERTLVLIKPDGVQRGLIGEIVRRFERRGLHLSGMKLMCVSPAVAAQHYAEHQGKPFYDGLIQFITASPVVAMVWEGRGAVVMVRTMMGATNPANAAPGTIRGDLAVDFGMNVVHGSDGVERAEQEVALFFRPEELVTWENAAERWIRE